jgi:hypothetical protein
LFVTALDEKGTFMDFPFVVDNLKRNVGVGFYLNSRASGHSYRLSPVRDLEQPRLWCVRVDLCMKSGMIGIDGSTCVAACGLTRAEMMQVFDEIREDVRSWLDAEPQRGIRMWLHETDQSTPFPQTGRLSVKPMNGDGMDPGSETIPVAPQKCRVAREDLLA